MIKYRKAREILDQVSEDYSAYDEGGFIDYSKLYKIIRRCNATLGEKINPEKQALVQIDNYKGRLPEDFSNLNFAFIAARKTVNTTLPSGFNVEYKTLCTNHNPCDPCLAECDNKYVIIQKCKETFEEYTELHQVKVTAKSFKHCNSSCPNLFVRGGHTIEIGDDGWIKTDFQTGHVYLNYVGEMEDEDDDLLVIDHPLIEPYYEAAIANQILKNILFNKEGDVAQLYGESKIELSRARTQAISFVQISGYKEIQGLFQAQRSRLFNKFFTPIDGA